MAQTLLTWILYLIGFVFKGNDWSGFLAALFLCLVFACSMHARARTHTRAQMIYKYIYLLFNCIFTNKIAKKRKQTNEERKGKEGKE